MKTAGVTSDRRGSTRLTRCAGVITYDMLHTHVVKILVYSICALTREERLHSMHLDPEGHQTSESTGRCPFQVCGMMYNVPAYTECMVLGISHAMWWSLRAEAIVRCLS